MQAHDDKALVCQYLQAMKEFSFFYLGNLERPY